ncbi:hypothetical protein P691DRAFT_138911 [Macrolepiota fuliginosa MF-IS2]|uniref:SIN1-type PH domain-containing protein n=1 Tax=Macrolepiota fuliginosa MF-IS2 TaxID=1400762 RepID=A0A9P6C363_9AGAR|nr:hypothetical protein P691DRAFT_138911 [Macrolepiota fuliginosa MF-IS2]
MNTSVSQFSLQLSGQHASHKSISSLHSMPCNVRSSTTSLRDCPGQRRNTISSALPVSQPLSNNIQGSRGRSGRAPTSIASSYIATSPATRSPPVRRRLPRQAYRISTPATSPPASTYRHHHSDPLSVSDLGRSVEPNTNRSFNQRSIGDPSLGSFASLAGPTPNKAHGKKRTQAVVDSVETRRSYTVFQRKLFRLRRRERILLLDKQWVHILPSSTKSLNTMFDTRKSLSYHVRLLVSAKVRSGGRSSIVVVGFKQGNKGRTKNYNMKAESRTIAAEIVQVL